MAAILVPSGDQTGPPPPRESIDLLGSGTNHLSSPPVAAMVSTWLVPSRYFALYDDTMASATRVPSGDHVGVPGANNES